MQTEVTAWAGTEGGGHARRAQPHMKVCERRVQGGCGGQAESPIPGRSLGRGRELRDGNDPKESRSWAARDWDQGLGQGAPQDRVWPGGQCVTWVTAGHRE